MKKFLSNILVFALILTLVQIPCFSVMADTFLVGQGSNLTSIYAVYYKVSDGSVAVAENGKGTYNNGVSRYMYATIDISALQNVDLTSAKLAYNYLTTATDPQANTFELKAIDTVITDAITTKDQIDAITVGESLGNYTITTENKYDKDVPTARWDKVEFDLTEKIQTLLANDETKLSFRLHCSYSPAIVQFKLIDQFTDSSTFTCEYEVKAADYTVSNLAISDAGASVNVNYTTDTSDVVTLYVAAYGANNQLLAVDSTSGDAVAVGDRVLELSLPEVLGAVDHYKAFVWNSSLIPACPSVSK